MGTNPSYYKGESRPVDQVTWFNAIEYCNALSRKEGLTPCYTQSGGTWTCNFNADGYRLPTEAEWEYAARGGNKSHGYKYSGSDSLTKEANELGLYDMSGGVVWEWCWDWYGSYSSSSQTNPTGASSGSERVFRGGCWNNNASYCRVASRAKNYNRYPSNSSSHVGFRVVRSSSK